MNNKGVIIEESLDNNSILREIHIVDTKVEPVTEKHQTPYLKQWTIHTIEVPEKKAEEIAEKISRSFDKVHPDWYVDYKNDQYHYIIYPNRIFKVDLKNPILYKNAKQHGISLGIPDYQVDFAPEDKVWERE